MSGLTTDGAPAMVRKHSRFTKKLWEAFEAQSVVVNHCIIHQANLCNKALNDHDVMKEVVHCISFIRFRGSNHKQFKFCWKNVNAFTRILCISHRFVG